MFKTRLSSKIATKESFGNNRNQHIKQIVLCRRLHVCLRASCGIQTV